MTPKHWDAPLPVQAPTNMNFEVRNHWQEVKSSILRDQDGIKAHYERLKTINKEIDFFKDRIKQRRFVLEQIGLIRNV